jgi:predicted nucleotidyltransferase component of viral defense system
MKIEYKKQALLAIRVLTYISKEKSFALKGGTAINFFINDLPRLSVDIDLAYIKFEPRNEAIKNINSALYKILHNLKVNGINFEITVKSENMHKINCFTSDAQIKIDMNYIARGHAFDPIVKPISSKIDDDFDFIEMQLLSLPELYGGKICTALSRQHPRDLFDIKILFDNEGLTQDIKN